MRDSLPGSRTVAVITRTRDRPITLERAFRSVASQTFRDFEWVVVNDGGDHEPVNMIAEKARSAGLSVKIIHIDASHGMEVASNVGLKGVQSQFFAIHDDDDSWQPSFLDEAVQFLFDNPQHKGVMVHCWRISERIEHQTIKFISRAPHEPQLEYLRIVDFLVSNISPPISFLYRTSLLTEVGYYDESMEVLGDWDFNLRVSLAGEIGVITKLLANYHVRIEAAHAEGAYRNSVPPGDRRQKIAEVLYRNRRLREDIEKRQFGLGVMLSLAVLNRPRLARQSFLRRWLGLFRK